MSNNSPFQVYLRIKPNLESNMESLIQEVDETKIVINKQGKHNKQFIFDRIFSTTQNNKDIFEESLRHNLDYFIEGYNTTILAYGITGSGKSHTIFGNEEDQGLSIQCLNYLVNRTNYMSSESNVQIELSFIEVYNETIRDLLSEQPKPLVVLQDTQKGVYIAGLQIVNIKNVDDIRDTLLIGNKNRSLASTIYNVQSSRSHAMIQVQLSYKVDNQIINPKLFIVDLAGSEKVYQDQNSKNQQEGSNINRSLLALSNCLQILSDKSKKNNHIPYRNSKLTRLLQDSLGGNTRTIMFACIQQTKSCYDEILNTLQYSSRATQIKRPIHKSLTQFGTQDDKLNTSSTNSELNSKTIYLTKIYNDIYTNIGEYYEINQSLIELQVVIQQNQYQIEEIYASSLSNNLQSINDDQIYHQLIVQQRDNKLIEQQLQHALKINLHQKQLQKSLLLQISEEQQQSINHWNTKYNDSIKQIEELKQELQLKNQTILQRDHLIQQQQYLVDSIKSKNPSLYATNDSDCCSYPSSFNSSTSSSQIKIKPQIQSINNNQLQDLLDRPRFTNLSHIKSLLAQRERSPININNTLFKTSPIRSPMKKKPNLANLNNLSSITKEDHQEILSTTQKRSRMTTEPHITTINLFGPSYLNFSANKENTS